MRGAHEFAHELAREPYAGGDRSFPRAPARANPLPPCEPAARSGLAQPSLPSFAQHSFHPRIPASLSIPSSEQFARSPFSATLANSGRSFPTTSHSTPTTSTDTQPTCSPPPPPRPNTQLRILCSGGGGGASGVESDSTQNSTLRSTPESAPTPSRSANLRYHIGMHGGDYVSIARKRAGLTQRELAERLGCRQATIARWERDDRHPSLEEAQAAVRACGFDLGINLVAEDRSWWPQIAVQLEGSPAERLRSLTRPAHLTSSRRWQSWGRSRRRLS